ncbi:MAG: DUF1553 domain-containing protein [Aureliella sp.]
MTLLRYLSLNLSLNFRPRASTAAILQHVLWSVLRCLRMHGRNISSARLVIEKRIFQIGIVAAILNAACTVRSVAGEDEARLDHFESKIRPALIAHCQDCHAVDSEASGGLLLDSKDGWAAGGDSGVPIVAGKPSESLLYRAITYDDPDLQMPPDGKLSESVIRDFEKWISDGAMDPRKGNQNPGESANAKSGLPVERAWEHWSYRPIERPQREEASAAASVVDYWVNQKIEESGLVGTGKASAETLARRLHYDLTGLPPSPETLAAFLAEYENQPDVAYSRLVEKLLSSPRFGEHFARHWLDVARYAESITLRGFVLPEAWRYRDYVIESFNSDRPFDRMMTEQVAGDLLPSDRSTEDGLHQEQLQKIATAFLVLGNTNLERQDKTQLEMDFIDEQLEVLGRAFLGQTIGCARCHDHKFDPIPTSDYYALAGIFRSARTMEHDNVSKWVEKPLPLAIREERYFHSLNQELSDLDERIAELSATVGAAAKVESVRLHTLPGIVLDDRHAKLDGPWKSSEHVKPFVEDGYHFLEASDQGQATYAPGDLAPGRYEVRVAYTAGPNRAKAAKVRVFSAAGPQEFEINQRKKPTIDGLWYSLGEFQFESQGQAYVTLFGGDPSGVVIADAVQFLPRKRQAEDTPGADALLAASSKARRSEDDPIELAKAELQKQTKLRKRLALQLEDRPKYLTLEETDDPRDIPIHIRGDVHNLGETVPRGFLTAILPRREKEIGQLGRLELANWLASTDNPLPARVYANRVWLWLMGRGIVSTPNNFGTTGENPSHPELLDSLALELISNNWSTKHLIRTIVYSDAYQRSSFAIPGVEAKGRETDPNNTTYWRGHRRRLSVEAIRDALLTISGEMELQIGGSLIKPGTKDDYNYQHGSLRRSVYQPVFRNSLPELFEAFDFADPSTSVGSRPRSTVATQALVLMNHPWVEERVKRIATRIQKKLVARNQEDDGTQLEGIVDATYLQLFSRAPTDSEKAMSLNFLAAASDDSVGEQELTRIWVHSLIASLDFRYLD